MQELSIFTEALTKEGPDERASFLKRACAGDPALRRRIERLLQRHEQAGSFLESPAAAPAATVDQPACERPGAAIGPYRLMEQIGEGGMGLVFVAEQQQPVRRKVALKVIKPGMDTREVIARFEAERQALALMDHPNIARVLDAGATPSGRPYFVMELVRGVPITQFCDDNRLTTRERLGLFVTVCQAVQHAHQKGIIHRDLKPTNVMVTLHDGVPVAKVIDFGVAKATGQRLTDKTIYTRFAQLVGTPLYMSPEQAQMSGLDIDTRADIYALGVLLYELLTGTTPFDQERLGAAGYDEMRRIIREEEPARPSTRLSTLGQAAATVSANRRSDPARLRQLFRGELDWIVMKALEKDRNRRYDSASAFAADVQRYLNDEPVLACPPSAWYRLRKLVRRHRGAVVTATTAVVLLLVGIIGTGWGLLRALEEKRNTAAALERVTQEQAHTQQALEAETRAKRTTQEALNALTEDVVAQHLDARPALSEQKKAFLRKVLALYEGFTQDLGDTEASRALRADGYRRVAWIRMVMGELADAEAAYQQALALLSRLVADFPTAPQYRHDLALAREQLALVWRDRGRLDDAEGGVREALRLRTELAADFADVPEYVLSLGQSYDMLGSLLLQKSRLPEAEAANRQALALHDGLAAKFPAEARYQDALARTHFALGGVLEDQGRAGEAEAQCREALATWRKVSAAHPEHLLYREQVAKGHTQLGDLLRRTARLPAAEAAYREALAIQAGLAADYPLLPDYRGDVAATHTRLGRLLAETGRPREAEAEYREALQTLEKLVAAFPAVPQYRAGLARAHHNLALALEPDLKRAEPAYRAALAEFTGLAAEFPRIPDYRFGLAQFQGGSWGLFLQTTRRPREAEAAFREAAAALTRLADDHSDVPVYALGLGGTCCNLGKLLADSGAPEDALPWFDKAVARLEAVRAREPRNATVRRYLRNAHWGRASALDALSRFPDAVKDWDQAVELSPPVEQPPLRFKRAYTLVRAGDPARATRDAEEWVTADDVTPDHLYAAARVFALAAAGRGRPEVAERDAARAVELLRLAYRQGYKGKPGIKDDKYLDSLRGREDFTKLLADLGAKKEP